MENILKLISEYKIESAFEEASALFPNAYVDLVALKSRFSKINYDYHVPCVISDSDYNLEIRKIIKGLIEVLTTLPNGTLPTKNEYHFHPLHRFPRGPMVPFEKIPRELIVAYAETVEYQEAQQIISEVKKFRLDADNDERVTVIRVIDLPPHNVVPPIDFWRRTFQLSCLHGPRMLGALLLVVSDEQFTQQVKRARRELMNYLESMWNI